MPWGRSRKKKDAPEPVSGEEESTPIPTPVIRRASPFPSPRARSKRKTWFRRFRASRSPRSNPDTPAPTTDMNGPALVPLAEETDDHDPLRPKQFQPNRLATLYVTPSDRNLYLAALAQLDQMPPPLPLWSDPAPVLPAVNGTEPFDADRLRQLVAETSASIPPSPTRQALALDNLDPKLVRSPQAGIGGLQVRDEFRPRQPRSLSRHAMLVLGSPSTLRFTGFPTDALRDLDKAVESAWSQGVRKRSDDLTDSGSAHDGKTWTLSLNGEVWKRSGSEELDTIRLLLTVLTTLAGHGWTFQRSLQVGKVKKDIHNLLFSHAESTKAWPPLFFAIAFPLPDRIALISPPSKGTPALLGAVRSAITDSVPKKSHKGIKVEGWVYEGVYRFWIDGWQGMRGKMSLKKVKQEQPFVLLSMINTITDLHYEFLGSIPLLPLITGRDVLFFSSLPGSGLSVNDTFRPAQLADREDRPISMFMVDKSESMLGFDTRSPLPKSQIGPLVNSPSVPHPLPSILRTSPAEPQVSAREVSDSTAISAPESQGPDSVNPDPARPGSTRSFRTRNVLLKKSSVKRKNSIDGRKPGSTNQDPVGPGFRTTPEHSVPPIVAHSISRPEQDERWTLINPPSDNTSNDPHRASMNRTSTTESAPSVYVDADSIREPELAHSSTTDQPGGLPGPRSGIPFSVESPRRRAEVTSVGDVVGVPSMCGSIGNFQSTMRPASTVDNPPHGDQGVLGTAGIEQLRLPLRTEASSDQRVGSAGEDEIGRSRVSLAPSESSAAAPPRTPKSQAREQAGSARTRLVQQLLGRQ